MDAVDNEKDQHSDIKKAGAWTFWIGLILLVIGVIILLFVIGYYYHKLGSIETPKECYLSNKDMKVAQQSRNYLEKFENKKQNINKLLCKNCMPCKKCPSHTEIPKPATERVRI